MVGPVTGRRTALAVLLTLAGAAAPARAAQRVASPLSPPGATCAPADPCDIATAINGAGIGDEVLLQAGDYGSAAAPLTASISSNAAHLTVHGPAGGPRPRIFFSVAPSNP